MIHLLVVGLSILLQGATTGPDRFNNFLVGGYVVMGVIAFAYVVSLMLRQRNVREDIGLMKRLLQEDENAGDS